MILEGCPVARRNRYRKLESLMAKVLGGDTVVFCLYMIFAGRGMVTLKAAAAVITILVSVGCIGWLVLTREFFRRRSLWMVTASVGILLCVVLSLLLKYPSPSVVQTAVAISPLT